MHVVETDWLRYIPGTHPGMEGRYVADDTGLRSGDVSKDDFVCGLCRFVGKFEIIRRSMFFQYLLIFKSLVQ